MVLTNLFLIVASNSIEKDQQLQFWLWVWLFFLKVYKPWNEWFGKMFLAGVTQKSNTTSWKCSTFQVPCPYRETWTRAFLFSVFRIIRNWPELCWDLCTQSVASLPYQNLIQKDLWYKVHYSPLWPFQKLLKELITAVHNYAVLKGTGHSLEVEPVLFTHFPKFSNWSSVTG